jgi:cell filamentation protein
MGDDPYVEPSSGLLANLLGISDSETWERAQAAYTEMRLVQLQEHPVAGRFDLAHLQAVHRHLTQDLVVWAGQLRTVDIAKADGFCPVQHLRSYAAEVFGRLADQDWLAGRSKDGFVTGLSGLYGDLNALHPFREFNGRAQRAFLSQLAAQAGWCLSWRNMSPEANITASIASFRGDLGPLRKLLDELVEPLAGPRELTGGSGQPSTVPTIGELLGMSFPPEVGLQAPPGPEAPAPPVSPSEVDLGL